METRNSNNDPKILNSTQIKTSLSYLSHTFKDACYQFKAIGQPTQNAEQIKKFEEDFAYLIDDIDRGPIFQIGKVIAECNELINNILTATQKKRA